MRRLLALLGLDDSKVQLAGHPTSLMSSDALNQDVSQWIGSFEMKGTESLTIDRPQFPPPPATDFALAEDAFRRELPDLVKEDDRIGRWVIYSKDGLVEEVSNEGDLYARYGNSIGKEHFVGRILPEPPTAEVNSNWFVRVDKSKSHDILGQKR